MSLKTRHRNGSVISKRTVQIATDLNELRGVMLMPKTLQKDLTGLGVKEIDTQKVIMPFQTLTSKRLRNQIQRLSSSKNRDSSRITMSSVSNSGGPESPRSPRRADMSLGHISLKRRNVKKKTSSYKCSPRVKFTQRCNSCLSQYENQVIKARPKLRENAYK